MLPSGVQSFIEKPAIDEGDRVSTAEAPLLVVHTLSCTNTQPVATADRSRLVALLEGLAVPLPSTRAAFTFPIGASVTGR